MDAFVKGAIKGALQTVFSACKVLKCDKMSLGFVCSECSRPVCQDHYYMRPQVPPTIVCIECIQAELDDFREALGRPRTRKRK